MEVYESILTALTEAIDDAKSEKKFLKRHTYSYDEIQHSRQETNNFALENDAVIA